MGKEWGRNGEGMGKEWGRNEIRMGKEWDGMGRNAR